MGINIVDRDKLDTALTATASAIRAKTGGSASIAFDMTTDMGFKSAIESIPSGGEDYFQYATSCNSFFKGAVIPDSVKIDLPHVTDLQYMFNESSGGDTVELTLGSQVTSMSYFMAHQSNDGKSTVTKLKIDGDLSAVKSYARFIRYCSSLVEVDADIDFRSISGSSDINTMFDCVYGIPLKIRFVPNTLSIASAAGIFNNRIFDDESFVSLCNCLIVTTTMKIIALSRDNKQRCTTLLGTVSQRTDDTGTYDFFTADAAGTVTLEQFITQTKGWTIA